MNILHLDIETAPNLAYVWGLWDQNVSINQIVESGYTMSWAAKWESGGPIHFSSIHEVKPEKMVKDAWNLLDQADAVVHYNGTKFDIPTLNREFIFHGLEPPSQFKQIDLLRTVRSQFKFPSNKLDYVAQELNLGAKTKHMGMEMWRDCMAGCPKAWKLMKRYNKQDVVLTQKLYRKLMPWIKAHPNWGVFLDSDAPTCRNCGSTDVKKNGVERTNTLTYQRYKCNACGKPLRGRKRIEAAPEGLTV